MKPLFLPPVGAMLSAALLLCTGLLSSCSKQDPALQDPEAKAGAYSLSEKDRNLISNQFPNSIETPTGLRYLVTKPGEGTATPKRGSIIKVRYELRLLTGPVIESSDKALGGPLVFPIGVGRVIRGWEEALIEMKLGEKRTLIVPHYLGYGVTGSPPKIPPYATLVFDIELLGF